MSSFISFHDEIRNHLLSRSLAEECWDWLWDFRRPINVRPSASFGPGFPQTRWLWSIFLTSRLISLLFSSILSSLKEENESLYVYFDNWGRGKKKKKLPKTWTLWWKHEKVKLAKWHQADFSKHRHLGSNYCVQSYMVMGQVTSCRGLINTAVSSLLIFK